MGFTKKDDFVETSFLSRNLTPMCTWAVCFIFWVAVGIVRTSRAIDERTHPTTRGAANSLRVCWERGRRERRPCQSAVHLLTVSIHSICAAANGDHTRHDTTKRLNSVSFCRIPRTR